MDVPSFWADSWWASQRLQGVRGGSMGLASFSVEMEPFGGLRSPISKHGRLEMGLFFFGLDHLLECRRHESLKRTKSDETHPMNRSYMHVV